MLLGHRAGLRRHLAAALHRGQAGADPAAGDAASVHDAHRALDAVLAALGPGGGGSRPARAAGLLELYAVAVQAAAGEAGAHLAPALATLSETAAEAVLAEDAP